VRWERAGEGALTVIMRPRTIWSGPRFWLAGRKKQSLAKVSAVATANRPSDMLTGSKLNQKKRSAGGERGEREREGVRQGGEGARTGVEPVEGLVDVDLVGLAVGGEGGHARPEGGVGELGLLRGHEDHHVVLEAEGGDEEQVHAGVDDVGPGEEVLLEAVLVHELELVDDEAEHPDGERQVAVAGPAAPDEEVRLGEAVLQPGVGHVGGEVVAEGGVVGGEAGVAGVGRELQAAVDHDEHEDDVGGGEGEELDAGLADELRRLRARVEQVDEGAEGRAEHDAQEGGQRHQLVHLGHLADARVPDLHQLLLAVRVRHELQSHKGGQIGA